MTDEVLPTECPHCGTELEDAVADERDATLEERNRGQAAVVNFVSLCPNPDCPSKDTDMAKAVEP
jgi:hypothetical protein